MVNFINAGGGHPLCTVHRAKDCTAGYRVDAGGINKRFFIKKLNQVDTSHIGRTVQGRAPLVYLLYGRTFLNCYVGTLYRVKGKIF